MSVNPTAVFDAWYAELEKLPYPVYRSEIPEDDALEYDERGTLRPFLVVEFGGPIRSARDRGIVSVRMDPYIIFLTVTAVAARAQDADAMKGLVIDTLLGLRVPDTGELQLSGAMSYGRASNSIRPTQFIASQSFQTITNLTS